MWHSSAKSRNWNNGNANQHYKFSQKSTSAHKMGINDHDAGTLKRE